MGEVILYVAEKARLIALSLDFPDDISYDFYSAKTYAALLRCVI